MRYAKQGLAGVLALSSMVGVLMFPSKALASEEGRRNTTYALGAAAATLLLTQHNKTAGILTGLAAAYAYKRWNDSITARHRREGYWDHRYRYQQRYYHAPYRPERWDPDYDGDNDDYRPIAWHHDNGKHLGWYKHGRIPPGHERWDHDHDRDDR
jgi:hypothetical protein